MVHRLLGGNAQLVTDYYCEKCKIPMTPAIARLKPRHECPQGGAVSPARGLGDMVAKVTTAVGVKPCGGCKQRQRSLNFLFPRGSSANDLYQTLYTTRRPIAGDECVVVTASDSQTFAHLQWLVASLRATNWVELYVVDLGMSWQEVRWLRRYATVIRRPESPISKDREGWQTFGKPYYLEAAPGRFQLWIDADCSVTRSLVPAFELIKSGPLVCWDDIAHRFVANWSELLRNKAPLDRQRLRGISAGVVGFDRVRDAGLLETWRNHIARAAVDAAFADCLSFFDQGALLLTLEDGGFKDSDLADPATWNCGEAVGDRTPENALKRCLVTRSSVLHFAGIGKLDLSAASTKLTEPTRRDDLEFFVCSHHERGLEGLLLRPWMRQVRLDQMSRPQLAENRLYLDRLSTCIQANWIGAGSWRWDEKWQRSLGLAFLDRVDFKPGHGYSPLVTRPDWVAESDRHHPGLGALLEELAREFPEATLHGGGPLANSFIVEREQWLGFVSLFRRVADYFLGRYGGDLPFDVGEFDDSRRCAYFFERVATAYFSGRLKWVQI